MFSNEDKAFASDFLGRVEKKISVMADKIGANFPTSNSARGEWDPLGKTANISNWTSAFWPGMMWLMFIKTGDEKYKKIAEGCEAKLDEAFDTFTRIHHDVGFMWTLSALADYKLTGNERSCARAMHAATILAGRYNCVAKYIRAWSWDPIDVRWAIIDCMMNIPILYWASEETGDPRFKFVALNHADTVMKTFIREDGSSNHIVEFDPCTGEVLATPAGQGYASGSAWSRGQSWAIYGFTISYMNTKKQEYLETACRVADYYMTCVPEGTLPVIDFKAPKEPVYYDASSASIAACGFIELANIVGGEKGKKYADFAISLLRALDKDCSYDEGDLRLLCTSSASYAAEKGRHMPWIFGDYYLLEALMKIYGNDGNFYKHIK